MKLISLFISFVPITKEQAISKLQLVAKVLRNWTIISLIAMIIAFILYISKSISTTAFCMVILSAIHGPIITCYFLMRRCFTLMPAREISRVIATQFAKR